MPSFNLEAEAVGHASYRYGRGRSEGLHGFPGSESETAAVDVDVAAVDGYGRVSGPAYRIIVFGGIEISAVDFDLAGLCSALCAGTEGMTR